MAVASSWFSWCDTNLRIGCWLPLTTMLSWQLRCSVCLSYRAICYHIHDKISLCHYLFLLLSFFYPCFLTTCFVFSGSSIMETQTIFSILQNRYCCNHHGNNIWSPSGNSPREEWCCITMMPHGHARSVWMYAHPGIDLCFGWEHSVYNSPSLCLLSSHDRSYIFSCCLLVPMLVTFHRCFTQVVFVGMLTSDPCSSLQKQCQPLWKPWHLVSHRECRDSLVCVNWRDKKHWCCIIKAPFTEC